MDTEPGRAGDLADRSVRADADLLLGPAWHRFLSPHFDDVSISCGGTAALLAANDHAPEVCVIFAEGERPGPQTAFVAEQHRRWRLDAEGVIAGRRREETAAATILGTVPRFLTFPDAIYRGTRYLDDPHLFGDVAPDEAALPAEIASALGLDRPVDPAARVYAPLALGNHVDHQHLLRAGLDAARSGWDVWFYEDLPYGLDPATLATRLDSLERDGARLVPASSVDVSATWRQKIDAIMCYASQVPVIFRHVTTVPSRDQIDAAMRAYAEAMPGIPVERYWRLAPA
ncbi:MAG: PIG-L family deacetylase [Chloroflexia bacterium]|nr:PIG-L family deacetylase [Chloroflexia bacterium]MDQ3512762.1 PIG-L family deacetylase [Chloroflexota bacterium]